MFLITKAFRLAKAFMKETQGTTYSKSKAQKHKKILKKSRYLKFLRQIHKMSIENKPENSAKSLKIKIVNILR